MLPDASALIPDAIEATAWSDNPTLYKEASHFCTAYVNDVALFLSMLDMESVKAANTLSYIVLRYDVSSNWLFKNFVN